MLAINDSLATAAGATAMAMAMVVSTMIVTTGMIVVMIRVSMTSVVRDSSVWQCCVTLLSCVI